MESFAAAPSQTMPANSPNSASSVSSSSSLPMPANLPHSPNSPNGVTVKPRLTKAQKNANHIASERKRRRVIRKGFDKLASIVPGMEGYARAEGIVLHGSASYIRQLMLARRSMIEALEKKGMHVPGHYKLALEELPEGWLDAVPEKQALPRRKRLSANSE